MKLLLLTDFSKSSSFAVDACEKLAITLNAQVDVFHSIDKETIINNYLDDSEISSFYLEEIHNSVQKKLNVITRRFTKSGLKCNPILKKGIFPKELSDIQQANNYDLIVMGSNGTSGIKEWALGSNAQKTVRNIPTNVMVIKEEISNIDFSQVVFVTSLDLVDQQPFKEFLKLISGLKVDLLHIMAVDTIFYFTQPGYIMREALKDFKDIADGFNIKTHFYSDYSIEAGVRHFVEEKGVSLIGIANHKKNPIKRIFTGSNVEAIVNQSKVPVISINYK